MSSDQQFDRARTYAIFENPFNGYREAVSVNASFWTLLFGLFYLAYRQVWLHVIVFGAIEIMLLAIASRMVIPALIVAHFLYARNTRQLLVTNYYRRGWRSVPLDDTSTYSRPI